MKLRLLILVSVALNLLLVVHVFQLKAARLPTTAKSAASRFVTNRVMRLPPRPANVPITVNVDAPFHWAQLESTDYRQYIANLRAVGCPELTVREMVVAEVDDDFSKQITTLVNRVTWQFWDLLVQRGDMEKMVQQKENELRDLSNERDELLASLFGDSNPLPTVEDIEWAVKRGDLETLQTIIYLHPEAVGHTNSQTGATPLHFAVETDHPEIVAVLLAAGADINAREISGVTPLHLAVQKKREDIADLLRQHGAHE